MRKKIMVTVVALAAVAAPASASANTPPAAENDFYTMSSQQTSLLVRGPGVLANDSDPDGDPLRAELYSPPFGTMDLRQSGRFTYTPPPGFRGLTSFIYNAYDAAGNFDEAYAYIYVTSPPQAADDSYGAISGARRFVSSPGVLTNDTASRALPGDPPDHGRVVLRTDGRFAYTSDPGFVGTDTFTYAADVPGETPATATVTMRVKPSNTAPVGVDDVYPTEEDVGVYESAPGVLGNDIDADGDPLVAEVVSWPGRADSFSFYPDGSFEYIPEPNFDSPDSFTYRIDDGLATSEVVRVDIEIRAVNDPPFAEDDSYFLGGGSQIDVPAPGVLGNDFDEVESDNLFARLRGHGPRKGTLDFRPNGSFTYVRTQGGNQPDRFKYQVRDTGGFGNTASVTISPGSE